MSALKQNLKSELKQHLYEQSSTLQNIAPEKFASEMVRTFEAGDLVFAEGEDSREMFVVIEGTVEIFKPTPRGEVKLATLERGEILGEMSLLESLPRSASARALGRVRLLAIQPGGFLLKIRRDPTFAFEIMQSLSRRIRVTNESLMKAMSRGETSIESLKAIMSGAEFSASGNDKK
ncbi:MAG: cyclic nucleotide-binding domain-containing protein [Bdellovibrionaceae bacterium]|nr:cyclic nucleotide-binding domain-containing protein [Pseudobdellovibrionaceae bacterium]